MARRSTGSELLETLSSGCQQGLGLRHQYSQIGKSPFIKGVAAPREKKVVSFICCNGPTEVTPSGEVRQVKTQCIFHMKLMGDDPSLAPFPPSLFMSYEYQEC